MKSLISGSNSANIQWRRINTPDFIFVILQMFATCGRITFHGNSEFCMAAISRPKGTFSTIQIYKFMLYEVRVS